MGLKCRISEYCNYKNIAISKFEEKSGLSNGYFNQVKKRPSSNKLDNIKSAFPDLNILWLLTGQGEMIRADNSIVVKGDDNTTNNNRIGPSGADREIELLKALIQEKDKQIALYQQLLKAKTDEQK